MNHEGFPWQLKRPKLYLFFWRGMGKKNPHNGGLGKIPMEALEKQGAVYTGLLSFGANVDLEKADRLEKGGH